MHAHNTIFDIQKSLYSFLLLVLLFFTPMSLTATESSHAGVKTLRINDYDMSYVERGKGAPLILVHGSLSDYRTWLPLLDEFSETNRTIAVSLRHHYPEKWDGKGNDLSIEQHVDDLAAFIQALNVSPVSLLGHSRGGAVALLMASKYPGHVHKLILADPSPLTAMLPNNPIIQADIETRKAKLRKVMDYYNRGDSDGGLKEFVSYVAGPKAWEKTSDKRRNSLRSNAWTTISLLHDIDIQFTCNNAGEISIPVLMVTGERSAPIYGHMNSALQTCMKQANDAIIADAGHMMFHANPTAFIFEVQDFISPQ